LAASSGSACILLRLGGKQILFDSPNQIARLVFSFSSLGTPKFRGG
jgi:hypothetical protein